MHTPASSHDSMMRTRSVMIMFQEAVIIFMMAMIISTYTVLTYIYIYIYAHIQTVHAFTDVPIFTQVQ